MSNIPPIKSFLSICGYKGFITDDEYFKAHSEQLDADTAVTVAQLGGSPIEIDTEYELAIGLLKSSKYKVVIEGKAVPERQRVLHSIFLLRDLKRQFPENTKAYNKVESDYLKQAGLSATDVSTYCLETHKRYLQEYAKENKYITFSGPNGEPISQEMNIILQYLMASDKDRPVKAKALSKLAASIGQAAINRGAGSPELAKSMEFGSVISNFPDAEKIASEAVQKLVANTQ